MCTELNSLNNVENKITHCKDAEFTRSTQSILQLFHHMDDKRNLNLLHVTSTSVIDFEQYKIDISSILCGLTILCNEPIKVAIVSVIQC